MVRDLTIDWAALITDWRESIFPYIKRCAIIDTIKGSIRIRNTEDISNLVVSHCQTVFGGKITSRNDMAIIDTFKEESAEVLTKTLLLNDEVDFTEFSYDIKLFKITRKHAFGANTDAGIDNLAYHIEIFNLNDPELIYRYRFPVSSVKPRDPVTFVVDVFNLINHTQV